MSRGKIGIAGSALAKKRATKAPVAKAPLDLALEQIAAAARCVSGAQERQQNAPTRSLLAVLAGHLSAAQRHMDAARGIPSTPPVKVGDRFVITGGVEVEITEVYDDGAVRYRLPDGSTLIAEAVRGWWKAVSR